MPPWAGAVNKDVSEHKERGRKESHGFPHYSSLFRAPDSQTCTFIDTNSSRSIWRRLFGVTGNCAACSKLIPAFEMVMRAKENVYHLDCFACQLCNQRWVIERRWTGVSLSLPLTCIRSNGCSGKKDWGVLTRLMIVEHRDIRHSNKWPERYPDGRGDDDLVLPL